MVTYLGRVSESAVFSDIPHLSQNGVMDMFRRVILLTWVMWLVIGAAAFAAAPYVVQSEGVVALIDGDGVSILENADIDALFAVRPGALYAAGKVGNYQLYDAVGTRLGDTQFAMIDDAGDALIFRQNGLCGAMDARGNIIVPAEWPQLISNGEGGFLALDGEGMLYHLDGSVSPAPLGLRLTGGLSAFAEGRMPYTDESGAYGCLDAAGSVAIPASFDWIGGFRDGASIAVSDKQYGLIDRFGDWIVPPRYRWMQRGQGFIAALTESGSLRLLSTDGKTLRHIRARATQAAVVGEYAALWDEKTAQLYDARGRCVLEAAPDALFFPSEGGQIIVSEGRWDAPEQYLMKSDGSVQEGRYPRITPLLPGRYAFLTMQGVEYYSELLDSLQISWNYSTARWGLMDSRGATLLPAEYLEIRAVGGDRLILRTGDTLIFTDQDGNPLRTWPLTPTRTNS